MERDFWSTENAPPKTKNKLLLITVLAKLLAFGMVVNAFGVIIGEHVFDITPHWPFISEKVRPYHIAAFLVYTFGSYITLYTHCFVFIYHCFHAYCQTLLLKAYFKNMSEEYTNKKECQKLLSEEYHSTISCRMRFAIRHHTKLVR